MIAVSSAGFSSATFGARPLAARPARRPASLFGGHLHTNEAVKEGRHTLERPASPSGGRSSGGSSGGGSDRSTSGGGGSGGGPDDSWGHSVLAFTAKHPNEVLTCGATVAAGAFALLWSKMDKLDSKMDQLDSKIDKFMRKQRSQTMLLKHNEKILNALGGAAQSGVCGVSAAAS